MDRPIENSDIRPRQSLSTNPSQTTNGATSPLRIVPENNLIPRARFLRCSPAWTRNKLPIPEIESHSPGSHLENPNLTETKRETNRPTSESHQRWWTLGRMYRS